MAYVHKSLKRTNQLRKNSNIYRKRFIRIFKNYVVLVSILIPQFQSFQRNYTPNPLLLRILGRVQGTILSITAYFLQNMSTKFIKNKSGGGSTKYSFKRWRLMYEEKISNYIKYVSNLRCKKFFMTSENSIFFNRFRMRSISVYHCKLT